VATLASRTSGGKLRIALLNRSWDQSQGLKLNVSGPATLTWLDPTDLSSHNESSVQVSLRIETRTLSAGQILNLPPHSLVRLDF
jgi:hypothetical protein